MTTSHLRTLGEIAAAGYAKGRARVLSVAENEIIASILAPVRDQVLANMRRESVGPVAVESEKAA